MLPQRFVTGTRREDWLPAAQPIYLSQPEPHSVLVWVDKQGVAHARDGKTGRIIAEGSDHTSVIQAALDSLRSGESVLVGGGSYVLDRPLVVSTPDVYVHAEKAAFKLNFGNDHAVKISDKGVVWRGGMFDALVQQAQNCYIFYADLPSFTDITHDPVRVEDVAIFPSEWGKIWGGIYIGGNIVGARIVNPRIRHVLGNGVVTGAEDTEIIGGSVNANNAGIAVATNNVRIIGVNVYCSKFGVDVNVPSYSRGEVVIIGSAIGDSGYSSIFVHTESSTPSDARTVIVGNLIGGGNWNNRATNDNITQRFGDCITIENAAGVKIIGNEFVPSTNTISAIRLRNSTGIVITGNSFRLAPQVRYEDDASRAGNIVRGNYGFPTDNVKATGVSVPIGTGNAYGSAAAVFSPSGVFPVPRIRVNWSGTFAAGEAVTVKVEAVYSDGSTAYVEKTATDAGSLWLGDDDLLQLVAQGKDIVKLNFYAKSSATSTSVTVAADVYG